MSYHTAKLKCLLLSALLAVTSEAVLWIACNRYGKMTDNDEWNTAESLADLTNVP